MVGLIECAGYPRDLGLGQGQALRSVIRGGLQQKGLPLRRSRLPSLGAWVGGRFQGSGVGLEAIRHYPHLAERADGLARGAGVPLDSILALQVPPDSSGFTIGVKEWTPREPSAWSLLQQLPGGDLVVRRSHPSVGFRSIEVTQPWLVTAVAGVNEVGLAASFISESHSGEAPEASSAPSAMLLVQECLQRFEHVEAGIEWCLRRPASGPGSVLLGDAAGARGRISFLEDKVGTDRMRDTVWVAALDGVVTDSWFDPIDGPNPSRAPTFGANGFPSAVLRLSSVRSAFDLRTFDGGFQTLDVE